MSYPHSFFGIITPVLQFTVSPWWPFVVLSVSVCFIIVAISWWRMHAFVALLLASLVAGLLTSRASWEVIGKDGKVVDTDLRGNALGLRLAELLGP